MSTIEKSNSPVANNIKKTILQKGLKIQSVAKMAEMSMQELYNSLNGKRILKANEIGKLSQVLDIAPNELYKVD